MARGPSLDDRVTVLLEIRHQHPAVELTPREQEVLALVAEGLSNQQVARRLGIRPRTVEKHLEHAYLKLGVDNRTAAVRRPGCRTS